MTQETKAELAHVRGHLDLAKQAVQMAYTQLNMAFEKLELLYKPPEEKK